MPGDLLGSIPLTALVISAQVISPSHVLQSLDFKVGVFYAQDIPLGAFVNVFGGVQFHVKITRFN